MKVFTHGNLDKYLDEDGLQYLIDELEKKFSSGGGNVDLSDYYNKEEINNIITGIPDGKEGVGISDIQLVNYELIITLTDGMVHNMGSIRGEKGEKGDTFTYDDFTEAQLESLKGTDGTSPTCTVTKDGKVATITCTDVNGTTTATISDCDYTEFIPITEEEIDALFI